MYWDWRTDGGDSNYSWNYSCVPDALGISKEWYVMDIKHLKNKYLQASHRCLNCRGDNIEGGSVQVDAGGATQDIYCNDCGSSWTDLYKLDDVVNVHIETGGDNGQEENVVAGP